jgi:hypothetical protein
VVQQFSFAQNLAQSENKYSPFAGLRWWMIEFFMKNTKIVDFYIFIELL